MKKIINFTLLAGAALLAMAGCQKDMTGTTPESETKTVSFFASEIETKTAFGEKDGNVYPTLWTANDTKVLVNLSYKQGLELDLVPSADFKTATFTGEYGGEKVDTLDSFTFMAVSPAAAKCINFNGDSKSVGVNVRINQTPIDGSVDERVHILVAKSATETEIPASAEFHFKHILAYGKMTLTNLNLAADEEVTTITLTASQEFAGRYLYHFDDNAAGNSEGDLVLAQNASASINLTTSSVEDVWFACAPVDLTDGGTLEVTVTTNKGTHTRTVTFPEGDVVGNFQAGKVSTFKVNMEESVFVENVTLNIAKVKEAPADWTGTYVVVVDAFEPANPRAWNMVNGASNRIFLTTAEDNSIITAARSVKDGANDISLEDLIANYSVKIAKTSDGYSIQLPSGNYITNTSKAAGYVESAEVVTAATDITLNEDYTVTIHLETSAVAFGFNPVNGNNRFNYFPDAKWSDKKHVSLYKYVE